MAAAYEIKCCFCLNTSDDLVDPRELPCGHVGCRTCLIGLLKVRGGELTCSGCHVLHKQIDFDSLKKVDVDNEGTTLTCDGFNCHVTAVNYCVTCDKKLCGTHLQAHIGIFGPSHKMITMKKYQQSPDKYRKVPCEHHAGEVLIEACTKCSKLACKRCDKTTDCKDLQHEFKSLAEVVEKITSTFEELIKLSNARRLDHLSTEKEVWKKLDVVDGDCKKWIGEIERARDEQIKQINEESEKVKQKVEKYLKEAIKKVEQFAADSLVVKDSLDISSARVSELMKKGDMTQKIKRKDELAEELTRSVGAEVASCEPTKNVSLIVKEKSSSFNADFIDLPCSLTLSSEHDTPGWCYSASHRADGDVLVGCEDGLHVFDNNTRQLTRCRLPYKQVYAAVEFGHAVYVLHEVGDTHKIDICLPNLASAQTLFEFKNPTHYAPHMSVSDTHVVVFSAEDSAGPRQLIIYNIVSKQKHFLPVATVHHPYFLSSGELLAAGDHQLVKYRICSGKLTTIWTTELKNICRVCADSNGVIFASTKNRRRSLYVISPAGELLREIKHNKLPGRNTGQISVKGDKLVVSGWADKKLYIFNKSSEVDDSTRHTPKFT